MNVFAQETISKTSQLFQVNNQGFENCDVVEFCVLSSVS